MLSLAKRIERAERIQNFWNYALTKKQREKLSDEQEQLVNSLFKKAGCETVCTECYSIMDTSTTPVSCVVCGSSNTVSPYYC